MVRASREEFNALVLYAVARRRLRRALRRISVRSVMGVCAALALSGADFGAARDPALLLVAMFLAYAWISGVYAARLHARSMMAASCRLTPELRHRIRNLDDFETLALAMAFVRGTGGDGRSA